MCPIPFGKIMVKNEIIICLPTVKIHVKMLSLITLLFSDLIPITFQHLFILID